MRLPFVLPKDSNGNPVYKFMDYFEPALIDQAGEPRYYGFVSSNGYFIIQKDATADGVESLKYFLGTPSDDFETTFATRAGLDYVYLHELVWS